MREDYAEAYDSLARRHWWWRARDRWVLEKLGELAPDDGWNRILDVGCGGGRWFDDLEAYGHVEGVEPDPSAIRAGTADPEKFHVRPFDEEFRPGRRYGLILFLDVLEHMAEPVAALKHGAHLLDPGGRIVITVPAFQALWTGHDELNRHHRRYTRDTLSRDVADAGLAVLETRYFFHWLVLPKLIVRGIEALTDRDPTPPGTPPRPVNRLLFGLCRLEQKLTSGGRLPFGSSVYLVAGKPGPSLDDRRESRDDRARAAEGGGPATGAGEEA